jgi:hypothetical protein
VCVSMLCIYFCVLFSEKSFGEKNGAHNTVFERSQLSCVCTRTFPRRFSHNNYCRITCYHDRNKKTADYWMPFCFGGAVSLWMMITATIGAGTNQTNCTWRRPSCRFHHPNARPETRLGATIESIGSAWYVIDNRLAACQIARDADASRRASIRLLSLAGYGHYGHCVWVVNKAAPFPVAWWQRRRPNRWLIDRPSARRTNPMDDDVSH